MRSRLEIVFWVLLYWALFMAAGILLSCSRHRDYESKQSLTDAQEYRDRLCEGYSVKSVPRCDRVTFDALISAFCPGKQDSVKRFELEPGVWHRDTRPCYADGQDIGSKSECSLDGYLAVLTYSITTGDQGVPRRMLRHLEDSGWYCGEGDTGATLVAPLSPLIRRAAGSLDIAFADPFAGFRGHLLAMWIWNDARLSGGLIRGGQTAINRLVAKNPTSPFYASLAHRWYDGDYNDALTKLFNLSECKSLWGSCPLEAYVAMTVAVMEGR